MSVCRGLQARYHISPVCSLLMHPSQLTSPREDLVWKGLNKLLSFEHQEYNRVVKHVVYEVSLPVLRAGVHASMNSGIVGKHSLKLLPHL